MHKDNKYTFKEYVSDLWHYIKPYKVMFFVAFFLRLTSDMARLYPAWAISKIVQILSGKTLSTSYHDLVGVFILWGLAAVYFITVHYFSKYLGYQVAEKSSLDLYKDTLSHVLRLDFSWQEKENSGNKMKRLDRGFDGVNNSIRRIFNVLIEAFVNIIGVIAIFFSLNKGISFSLMIFIIIYVLIGTRLLKKAIRQERIVNKSFEDLSGFTFELLNNIQTIKSLGIQNGVLNVVSSQIKPLILKIKKRILSYQSMGAVLKTCEDLFKYLGILYLGFGVYRGTYDISLLVLFIGYFDRISSSSAEVTDVVQEIAKSKIWISRAKQILTTIPVIENSQKLATQSLYKSDWGEISVKNVNFSYKKSTVLDNVSLKIKRNEKIGIVGLSGAGKSTLFKLFLDLYENYQGDIFFDNISLKKIQRQSYIDHVSVVLQDTELFNMSLRENIEIASVKKDKDQKLLNEVIVKAHLDEVVAKLPDGIDTVVGEKGIKLSGGQRQRVGIARALYRQPDILLLDEATSHLDSHSEREIQKAISENVNQFTAIVIAHRLSTIKAMDKIVVLDNGKVVEQGSFDELIKSKGKFCKMWNEQKTLNFNYNLILYNCIISYRI